MGLISRIKSAVIGPTKDVLLKTLIKKQPVIVKDVESQLLSGKHALITGGNSGIGYAIAKKMIACGATVTILGRNAEKTAKVAEELGCDYLLVDLTDTQLLIDRTQDYLKDKKIDILVNSAGIRDREPWLSKTPTCFDQVMSTNLKAIYFMCQTLANHMLEKGIHGHILNISSSSSMRPSWGPYQLSKRALNGMTLGFAQRLAPNGITVNGIAPGVTLTPMVDDVLEEGNLSYPNPMRRAETPEEIANLAIFLCSELGNSIIGDTIMMTGGSGNLSCDY